MKIRVHHLLCMQGYQGKGYNEAFVKRMTEIVNLFKTNPKTLVELVAESDEVCVNCPHRSGDICLSGGVAYDPIRKQKEKRVAEFLELELSRQYEIGFLFNRVNEKIVSTSLADDLYCKDCEWQGCCLWYQNLK